ncbi:MAG: DUF1786 domain-containing protein [Planctomycetes bacterium]|nr:DUF1786 domain-containing protein [Planctomycetota bacterium]
MKHPLRLLAIDIGGGTQDILIHHGDREIENCPKLILPAPTQIVAGRIRRATDARRDIFLTGNLMGGGACNHAIEEHIEADLRVYAEALPAKTIHDNLDRVREMGVRIVSRRPRGAAVIKMEDIDLPTLRQALEPFGVSVPARAAIAVLDHGNCPTGSNRRFRFEQWWGFLENGGGIMDLAYRRIPPRLTRMRAVRRSLPGAMLMDTGAAAVWGALCDEAVARRRRKGVVIVNLGNQHTLAVLLKGETVWGIFEHHTGCMTRRKLGDMIDRLRDGSLTNEEVFEDFGHGCAIRNRRPRGGFEFVTVLGPKRALAKGLGYHLAAPYGDMMLAGAFGLVAAYEATMAAPSKTRSNRD